MAGKGGLVECLEDKAIDQILSILRRPLEMSPQAEGQA